MDARGGSTGRRGEITATVTAEEGEYLFLNFVASKGYTVTVNGKKAELIDNDLHFLSVALEEGENVVKFSYSSPYIKYFAAGIAAAVVALLAVALIVKKTKFMQSVLGVIAWTGVALAVGVVLFFMAFSRCRRSNKIVFGTLDKNFLKREIKIFCALSSK